MIKKVVALLEVSLRQGQGYGVRRRLHWFSDWQALTDYPPFQRIITSQG